MRLLLALLAAVCGWMLLTSYQRKTRPWLFGVMLVSFAGSTVAGAVIPW